MEQTIRLIAVHSLPIFDPIVTILTVKDYRENMFRIIRNFCCKIGNAVRPSSKPAVADAQALAINQGKCHKEQSRES